MSDHSQRGQLVPEPGLVPADPQLAGRRVLQRTGLLDQPGERPQLGLVQGEIGPVGQQEMRLAAAERQEHLEERNRVPLHGDRHAQVEPVGLAGQLIGGHRDLQRIPGLPVVRGLAADLEDQPGLIGQQRQQLGGEPHRVDAGQAGARGQRARSRAGQAVARPEQAVAVQRQVEAGQQRPLGGQVPVPVVRPLRLQRRAQRRVSDPVGPFPAHIELVTAAVAGPQHQVRPGDRGRGERPVRGDHGRGVPQPRVIPVPEPGRLGRGYLQRLAAQGHLLQRRRHRPDEPGQPEPPAAGFAPGRLGRVDAHRAVPLGPDERDRRGGFPASGADHRDDPQPVGCAAGHVQAELGVAVSGQHAALARVHQPQADRRGLIEQRPELP